MPATIFHPQDPSLAPETHFPLQSVQLHAVAPHPRFVNRFDSCEILLVVDVNNGRHANGGRDPVGGCSFMFKSPPDGPDSGVPFATSFAGGGAAAGSSSGKIAFQLERRGPRGAALDATSNRANLRAVIAALRFRAWGCEGWRRVVVLTDLMYVVEGATTLLPAWAARRWRAKRRGGKIANRDLWEELQASVEELRETGCEVSFWLVVGGDGEQCGFIREVKEAARSAARKNPDIVKEVFTELCGIMV